MSLEQVLGAAEAVVRRLQVGWRNCVIVALFLSANIGLYAIFSVENWTFVLTFLHRLKQIGFPQV